MVSLTLNSDPVERNTKRRPPPVDSPATYFGRDRESHSRWRSEKKQRIYCTKLIHALRQLRPISASSPPSDPRRTSRAIREASDRTLAAVSGGRMVWNRAILTGRCRRSVKLFKFRNKQRRRRPAEPTVVVSSAVRKQRVGVLRLKGKTDLSVVKRKVRALGRLVPGCRKQPLPVVLEETADYIAALEMQVRVMSSLAELFSRNASVSAGSGALRRPAE